MSTSRRTAFEFPRLVNLRARWRFVMFGGFAACLSPTEITLRITTNVPCSQLDAVDIIVGASSDLETLSPSAKTTMTCDAQGNIGSLVLLPGSSGGVSFSVIGGVGTASDTCRAQGYHDCIVARRELQFISHKPLTLPVELDARCLDQICPETNGVLSTCVNGSCVPAKVTDPTTCTTPGGCADAGTSHVITPVTIGSAGVRAYATGYGPQLHIIQAQEDGRTWVFYVDGAVGTIKSRVSSDFSTWADGDAISLGGSDVADGYGFSVAYAIEGTTDTLHLVANTTTTAQNFSTVHIRSTIAAGHLTPPTLSAIPNTSQGSSCPFDGPSTTIAADGHVYDVTGWTDKRANQTFCDTDVYRSDNIESGASFTAAFTQIGYFVSINSYTYAHQLLALPQANVVLVTYPDQDDAPPYSDHTIFRSLGWALSNNFGDAGVVQPTTDEVFYSASNEASYDDWNVCRLTDTDVHAVRHVLSTSTTTTNTFEEARFDGKKWTLSSQAPPAVTGASNTGVVLVSDANPNDGMLLATIASDNAIHVSKWTATAGWSEVATLPGAAPRHALAGTSCGSGRARIMWTEGNAAPYALMGADITSLLF